MVGKKSLAALCCASALLLAGAGSALAADDGMPYEKLVEVTVPNQDAVDSVVENYDAAEYKRVEDDGTIMLNVFATDEEEAALKAAGYKIGGTIEDSNTGVDPHGGAPGRRSTQEALAADVAENGMPKGGEVPGQVRRPDPGRHGHPARRHVHRRGRPLRRHARRRASSTSRRSTSRRGSRAPPRSPGPTLALSYAGADGVYTHGDQHGPLHRHRPDAGRVHVPPAADPPDRRCASLTADDMTIRIATAATAGGAAASVETFPVTEWLGKDLPPHVAGFKNRRSSRTTGSDREPRRPRRARRDVPGADVGRQHAGEDLRLPAQVAGDHVRHRRASARLRPATLGAPLIDTTGEITAAQPVATIPFTATAGQAVRATVDAIPSG